MSRQSSSKDRYRAGSERKSSSPPFFHNPFQAVEDTPASRRISAIAPHETRPSDERFSLSSYRHPYDILPPGIAHGNNYLDHPSNRHSHPFDEEAQVYSEDNKKSTELKNIDTDPKAKLENEDGRHQGVLSNLMDFYGAPSELRSRMERRDSTVSRGSDSDSDSDIPDADDPRMTGVKKRCLDDYEDERWTALRQMNYKQRRKERQKVRIEFNVTCEYGSMSYSLSMLTFLQRS